MEPRLYFATVLNFTNFHYLLSGSNEEADIFQLQLEKTRTFWFPKTVVWSVQESDAGGKPAACMHRQTDGRTAEIS